MGRMESDRRRICLSPQTQTEHLRNDPFHRREETPPFDVIKGSCEAPLFTNPQSALLATSQPLAAAFISKPQSPPEFARRGGRQRWFAHGPGPGLCDVGSCGTAGGAFPGDRWERKLAGLSC